MKSRITFHLQANKRVYQSLFSACLMLFLIWFVDPLQLLRDIKMAPYEWIIPWSLFYEVLVVLLWSGGALVLLRPYKPVEYNELVASGFKLQGLTLVMPGRTGDIGLIYFLRDKVEKDVVASFLVIDKLLTLLITAIIASVGIVYFYNWIYALLFVALFLISCMLFRLFVLQNTLSGIVKPPVFLQKLFDKHLQGIRKRLVEMSGDYRNIVINLFFTFCRSILAGISFTLILHWFGAEVSFSYVIMIQAMAQIIAIIPITYMGIGLVESINIHLLGFVGIDASLVLAASLATRAIQILFYLMIGFVCLRPWQQIAD